jgi:hypothetical protein
MGLYEDLAYVVETDGEVRNDQHLDLLTRWKAWEEERPRALPGEVFIPARPTGEWAWERVATRLRLRPLAEPVESQPEHVTEVAATSSSRARLPAGRSREELEIETRVRLELELTKKLENNGKPSLRSIQTRMRELGYPVSYRRVRDTWHAMQPD